MIVENYLELIDIEEINIIDNYFNMVDIHIKDDESFLLSNGIISHNSAAGSLKQARDIENDAVYALKGKIKNTRRLSDLSENVEIMEIMSILDIEPGAKEKCAYNNIIIATDSDADGQHIEGLIVNFFYKWFPHIIENGKLLQLITPLVVCNSIKERKYFYSLDEFTEYSKKNKVTSVNYLKGLGSLSLEDWKFVMDNKKFFKISADKTAEKYLDIAFGNSPAKRKTWLELG